MPEIQSLTTRVQELQKSFDFWNTGYVWFVALTVILAFMVFFTQFMSIRRGKELAQTQTKLLKAKDDQLFGDLKEKDVKIAEAEKRASTADERASEANKHAQELTRKTEELKQHNLETESSLEKEHVGRLEMETAISPRIMEQKQSAKELEGFHNMSVVIESLAESEPWRTAGQIAFTLDLAKWNVIPGMKRFLDAPFFDGVTVVTNVGAIPKEDHSSEAADALIGVLTKNNIKSHRMPTSESLPINTIKIQVGLKPAEYFSRERKDSMYGNMLYK